MCRIIDGQFKCNISLCNGQRLIVEELKDELISRKIPTGHFQNQNIILPLEEFVENETRLSGFF